MRKREPAPELAAMESRMSQIENEVIEQDNELPPEDERDIDPDNPDGELPDETDETPADDGEVTGLEVTIEGFEPEPAPEEEGGKPWVNELRKKYRESQKRLRELEAQVNQGQKQEESVVVGKKPTLADCEFDDERYEREFSEWTERKVKFDQQQRAKQAEAEAVHQAFQARVQRYNEEKTTLPVDDYDDAEALVESAFNQTQQGILVKTADKPAELVYALGKNPKALESLAGLKDPIDFAVALGKIMANIKTAPKKSIPSPERVVRGGASGKTPATTSANLDKLRDEAARTGDYTAYFAAKAKAR